MVKRWTLKVVRVLPQALVKNQRTKTAKHQTSNKAGALEIKTSFWTKETKRKRGLQWRFTGSALAIEKAAANTEAQRKKQLVHYSSVFHTKQDFRSTRLQEPFLLSPLQWEQRPEHYQPTELCDLLATEGVMWGLVNLASQLLAWQLKRLSVGKTPVVNKKHAQGREGRWD